MGKSTERSYFYQETRDPLSKLHVNIDTRVSGGEVDRGVVLGEGDGTVPLLSIGYMCSRGWKIRRYNPAATQVITFEMPHEPDRFNPRGGPNTGQSLALSPQHEGAALTCGYIGDHVDILGRQSLNDLILRVAAGKGDSIEDHVVSNIVEYSKNVRIFDDPKG